MKARFSFYAKLRFVGFTPYLILPAPSVFPRFTSTYVTPNDYLTTPC